MKRIVIVILALMLLPAAFVIGYFTRPILRPPGAGGTGSSAATVAGDPGSAAPTPAAGCSPAPAPAAPATSPATDEPRFKLVQEESGALKNILGAEHLWRYQGGPPRIHVQYFVDFREGRVKERPFQPPGTGSAALDAWLQDGVKKRAYFQAFNLGPARGFGQFPELHFDAKQCEGVIAVDKKRLRTVHQFRVGGLSEKTHGGQGKSTAPSAGPFDMTSDVFDWYQQASADPKQALVLDFDTVGTDSYSHVSFRGDDFGGGITGGFDETTLHFGQETAGTYAGQPGRAILLVVIDGRAAKVPASEEACEAEVARLRKELAAKPDDAQRKWELAWAVDCRCGFANKVTRETAYPAPDETVQLVRDVSRQLPGNMFYRAELRRLLFRQAFCSAEGFYASRFPGLLKEILSLVPLANSEHLEAAQLLLRWKHAKLKKGLPENEKARIVQETDAQVVQLLRRHAEVWQNHPEEIQKKLQAYEKDAAGQSYAETPEFKELLDQMRDWAKKG